MIQAFPEAQMVKNPPAIQDTQIWSLGWEDPLQVSIATHSSIFAWKIPWIEDPGGLHTVHGVTKSQTQLSDWAQHSYNITPQPQAPSSLVHWSSQSRHLRRYRGFLGFLRSVHLLAGHRPQTFHLHLPCFSHLSSTIKRLLWRQK